MKSTLFIFLFSSLFYTSLQAQKLSDDSFTSLLQYELKKGDSLMTGAPANYSKEYAFITKKTKKKWNIARKIADVAGSAGVGVASLGGATGSLNTVITGMRIGSAANAAGSAVDISDILSKTDNPLAGKTFIIEEFKKGEDNMSTQAIVKGPDSDIYIITLDPAIATREILTVNGKVVSFNMPQEVN